MAGEKDPKKQAVAEALGVATRGVQMAQEQMQAAHAARLAAVADSQKHSRLKQGLDSHDVAKAVQLVKDGNDWPRVKANMPGILDAVLESWRDEIYRRATVTEGRRMPDGPGQPGHKR